MQQILLNRTLLLLWKQALTMAKAGLIAGLLLVLAAPAVYAQVTTGTGFYKDFVVLDNGNNTNNYYYTNQPINGLPNFQGNNLGSFDVNSGRLFLGAEASTRRVNGDNVLQDGMALYYRVYQGTTATGSFASLPLTYLRSGDDGDATSQTWSNTYTRPNLLAGLNMGTYTLEVYFMGSATYSNSGGSGKFDFYDSRGGNNYQATFTVTGTRTKQAQWNGMGSSTSNNWFDPNNWTPNTVPDATTDVVIPYLSGGTAFPSISDGAAYVHDLTLVGNPNGGTAKNMFQTNGQLRIYGNFSDNNGVFQQTGGTFTLASSTENQTFTGESLFNVNIEGGTTKTLSGLLSILQSLNFVPSVNSGSGIAGGILVTDPRNVPGSGVQLGATTSGQTATYDATISNETESSYVKGIVRTSRLVSQGTTNYFGNIGVDLLVTSGQPKNVVVTRSTGGTNGFNYQGVNGSQSIRRGFSFQPDNPNDLTFDMTFHYLDVELTGTGIASDNDLRLFRSPSGTIPFEGLAYTSLNTVNNYLYRTGITGTLAATFTLGDINNPLPVTLASFTATAAPKGTALLRWVTASELNNKGFGVERQLDGGAWEQVGYVAGTNQANGSSYSYLDEASAGAATKVYYRLRQEDLNGTATYSPVAAIGRTAASAGLALYPVPATSQLQVSFAEAGQAGSEVTVTNMQGQQVLRYLTTASPDAALNLPVQQLAAGVYVLSVRVPGQAAQHARFTKE